MAPKYPNYPVRRFSGVEEIRVGDVVRMRHDDEIHGGVSPAFDDSIVLSIDGKTAVLARPYVSICNGEVRQHIGQTSVDLARIVESFDVLTRGHTGEIDNRVDEQQWSVRFVHKVSPSDSDTHPPVALERGVFEDRKALAAALRDLDILPAKGTITECRYEDGRYLVFPQVPGMTTFWHCIVFEFVEQPKRVSAEYA